MPDPIYILGHKNPDWMLSAPLSPTRRISTQLEKRIVGRRCGNSNARIDAILKRFKLPLPKFIGDVTPRVEDIMTRDVQTVTKSTTCAEALELIDEYDVRALPVVDESNKLEGTISIFQLGESFIPKPRAPREMRRVHTSVSAIIRSLNAKVLVWSTKTIWKNST